MVREILAQDAPFSRQYVAILVEPAPAGGTTSFLGNPRKPAPMRLRLQKDIAVQIAGIDQPGRFADRTRITALNARTPGAAMGASLVSVLRREDAANREREFAEDWPTTREPENGCGATVAEIPAVLDRYLPPERECRQHPTATKTQDRS